LPPKILLYFGLYYIYVIFSIYHPALVGKVVSVCVRVQYLTIFWGQICRPKPAKTFKDVLGKSGIKVKKLKWGLF